MAKADSPTRGGLTTSLGTWVRPDRVHSLTSGGALIDVKLPEITSRVSSSRKAGRPSRWGKCLLGGFREGLRDNVDDKALGSLDVDERVLVLALAVDEGRARREVDRQLRSEGSAWTISVWRCY